MSMKRICALSCPAVDARCLLAGGGQGACRRNHRQLPQQQAVSAASHPTRVYFGDTHLHTAMSMDAGAFGNRLGVEDAYRFARGEELMASSGQKAKLSRPLDFLVVADHSDNMGFFPDLFAGKPEMLADPTGKKWYDMMQAWRGQRGGAGHHRQVLARHVSRRS